MNRYSTYTSTSAGPDDGEEKKQDMWLSMLDDVASGKKLPEKNMLVLGTTPHPWAMKHCLHFADSR